MKSGYMYFIIVYFGMVVLIRAHARSPKQKQKHEGESTKSNYLSYLSWVIRADMKLISIHVTDQISILANAKYRPVTKISY